VRVSYFGRWAFVAAAVILPASLLHAALPSVPDVEGLTSLAGHLLIASPKLSDPPFDHAVIILARHSNEGALGIVINRPAGERPVAELLTAMGADASGVTGSVRIFRGGPVSPEIGFVIHTNDYRLPDTTMDIDGRLALTSAPDILRDIGRGRGPKKSLLAFGYAGWAPEQLEDELKRGFWLTLPEDPMLVFDEQRDKLWADAVARHKPPLP
jgi:putative transcriptional regulator